MANNFFQNYTLTQFVNQNGEILSRRLGLTTEYRATFNHAPNELARLLLHAYQLFLVFLSTAEPN